MIIKSVATSYIPAFCFSDPKVGIFSLSLVTTTVRGFCCTIIQVEEVSPIVTLLVFYFLSLNQIWCYVLLYFSESLNIIMYTWQIIFTGFSMLNNQPFLPGMYQPGL